MQGKGERRALRPVAMCLVVLAFASCAGERRPLWETTPADAGSILGPQGTASGTTVTRQTAFGTTTGSAASAGAGANTLITPGAPTAGAALPQSTTIEQRTVIQATPGVTYREIPTEPPGTYRYDDPRRPGYYFYPEPEVRCSDVQRTCARYSSKRGDWRLDSQATQLLYGSQGTRTRQYRQPGDGYDPRLAPVSRNPTIYRAPQVTTPQASPVP